MRKIKFRAWDKENKEFIPESFTITNSGNINTIDMGKEYVTPAVPLKNFILMQYTGLKDKNGNEIYEGDIVQCKEGIRYFRHVVFEDGNYYLVNPDNKMPFPIQVVTSSHTETEVIGNIYENPDLLT